MLEAGAATSHGNKQSHGLRIPYATPVSARMAATTAFAWPSVVAVLEAMSRCERSWSLGLAVANAILHALVGYRCVRMRSRTMATVGMAVGAMYLFLGFGGLQELVTPEHQHWIVRLTALTILTAAYAALLPQVTWKHLIEQAHESSDSVQIIAAVWVIISVGLAFATGVHGTSSRGLAIAFGLLMPLGVALAAVLRMKARRRWLARIASGVEGVWRIVAAVHLAEKLPVLTPVTAGAGPSVLVHVQGAEEPFRASEHIEPVAILASGSSPHGSSPSRLT